MKTLSEIQNKAEERKRQVTTTQQVTAFQLPEATQATAGHAYILTIPDTQPASAQPTSYLVVDDQQSGTSRQLMFSLSPTKTVNPPSVAAVQQEEIQHNTSGLSSLFGLIPSVLQYQQIDTPQPFSPSHLQPAKSPVPYSKVSTNEQISLHKSHKTALLRAT